MHAPYHIPIWKSAPFIRLLIPILFGVILQWYLRFSIEFISVLALAFTGALLIFFLVNPAWRYRFYWVQGLCIQFLLCCFALFLTYQNDIRIQKNWFGNHYQPEDILLLTLQEPVEEKPNSYKAEARVDWVIGPQKRTAVAGNLILYFAKDSLTKTLKYGHRLIIQKNIQPIRNSGNPGAFDYKRYAHFQQLFYTVYVREPDFILLNTKLRNPFRNFLFEARAAIVQSLQKFLPPDKSIRGIAEALLIGYKLDLEKDLLQAYSNTGVVHIIAISGLHLGLIYVLLVWIFDRIPGIRKSAWMKVCFVLACLWLFSLLTGGSASVLRSAVMFTCIVIGKYFFTQSSVYNSMAASATLLICYDPYLIWDVGFQLSYLAVWGIVALQRPLFKLLYFPQKALRYVWAMVSVTLAAQVAAFPICIYYFHQFPNFFLPANMITVPLSEIILIAEILLLVFSWNHFLASLMGDLVGWLIGLMNKVVAFFNSFSFSVYEPIYANAYTTLCLYLLIVCLSCFFLYKKRGWIMASIGFLFIFCGLHYRYHLQTQKQSMLIVYHVSKYKAVDVIEKNQYLFWGDSVLMTDSYLQNFHLKPSRISLHLNQGVDSLNGVYRNPPFFQIKETVLLWIDRHFQSKQFAPTETDYILVSDNADIEIQALKEKYNPRMIIFDGTNSLWKIALWKSDCEELHLPCFSVAEQGAFILPFNH